MDSNADDRQNAQQRRVAKNKLGKLRRNFEFRFGWVVWNAFVILALFPSGPCEAWDHKLLVLEQTSQVRSLDGDEPLVVGLVLHPGAVEHRGPHGLLSLGLTMRG